VRTMTMMLRILEMEIPEAPAGSLASALSIMR
jgi:hypothetical protein